MSRIDTIIELSNFEIVRSKIAQVLAIEIANQITLIDSALEGDISPEREAVLDFYKSSLPLSVWESRFLPPGQDEMQFLNIVYVKSSFEDLVCHSTQTGIVNYIIEGWSSAKTVGSSNNQRGDYLASAKLERMLAVARAILSDKRYARFDTSVGNINKVGDIEISQPETDSGKNMNNVIYGKIMVSLKIAETVPEVYGLPWFGSNTELTLNETQKGFEWIINK